jgi:hypothetical protein
MGHIDIYACENRVDVRHAAGGLNDHRPYEQDT